MNGPTDSTTTQADGPEIVGAADPRGAMDAKVAALEDSVLRARAELQNFQRRAASERQDSIRYANAELMKSLLTVLDDFERTLKAAEKPENQRAIVDGVKLVYSNLLKALTDQGLEPIDARGKPFDPLSHEALLQQPSDDVAPGMVLDQVASGYRLRDRVLRPAKVIVAQAKES